MHDDLEALAARCEAATGPDRELDAAIAKAVGAENGGREIVEYVSRSVQYIKECSLAYTSSLDAAMTLMPTADWPWNVAMATAYGSASVMPCDGKSTGINDKRGGHCRGAPTPALALCAAYLRARSAQP